MTYLKKRRNSNNTRRDITKISLAFFLCSIFYFFMFFNLVDAAPQGPSSISVDSNETKGSVSAATLNISGGRIATINITAENQNPRWKGFIGQIVGTFTLDDSTSSTLYDWTMATVGGEIYATRNSSTPGWTTIRCANISQMENENYLINHTNSNDNVTKTFNGTSHSAFVVATTSISANTCPTLNTYKNNATQDTDFEEMILTDNTNFSTANYANLIYSTILETNVAGFDGGSYDFQMVVPEIGYDGFSGSTAYYLYVELS